VKSATRPPYTEHSGRLCHTGFGTNRHAGRLRLHCFSRTMEERRGVPRDAGFIWIRPMSTTKKGQSQFRDSRLRMAYLRLASAIGFLDRIWFANGQQDRCPALDFLQVQTLDQLRIIPWITDDRPAGGPDKPFDTINVRGRSSETTGIKLYSASFGTPQQMGEPLARWSDRAQRLNWEGRHTFPCAGAVLLYMSPKFTAIRRYGEFRR
jgi:hypothetical protein